MNPLFDYYEKVKKGEQATHEEIMEAQQFLIAERQRYMKVYNLSLQQAGLKVGYDNGSPYIEFKNGTYLFKPM